MSSLTEYLKGTGLAGAPSAPPQQAEGPGCIKEVQFLFLSTASWMLTVTSAPETHLEG